MSKSRKKCGHGRRPHVKRNTQRTTDQCPESSNSPDDLGTYTWFGTGKPASIKVVPAEGEIIDNGGLLGLRELVRHSGLLNIKASTSPRNPQYSDGDCLALHLAVIAQGNSHYAHSERMRANATFAKIALGLPGIASTETVRQRFDLMGLSQDIPEKIFECMNTLVTKVNYVPNIIELEDIIDGDPWTDMVTRIFIDNSVFANSNCKKEGVEPTYNKEEGYFPAFAYDDNNMPISGNLFEGSTHSLHGIYEFIDKTAAIQLSRCPETKQLFVLDAAYDSLSLTYKIDQDGNFVITKLNARRDEGFYKTAVRLAESTDKKDVANREEILHDDGSMSIYVDFMRTRKKNGLFIHDATPEEKMDWRFCSEVRKKPIYENGLPTGRYEIKVFTVWTNIFHKKLSARQIIELYRDRGTMEQSFGEIKSQMRHEKFPSGKFQTNRIVFALMLLAMTMLKIMGTYLVECELNGNKNYNVKRRLVGTIIQNFIRMPGVLIYHGRQYILKIKGCFEGVAEAFCRFCTNMCKLA